jgi:chemotaxis methyl-accepting protein methylase
MLLAEEARRLGQPLPPALIDATDYDRPSLARAAAASYPRGAVKDLPADLARRYLEGDDPVTVVPELRGLIRAVPHDLTHEPPPAPPYELILCRNVVIYFDGPTQERIASALTGALQPGGCLLLGKVEALRGEARRRLVLENPRERLYRRP